MPHLKEGDAAPEFTLKTVVLFFYPKDDTPGCTIECKEFRDARSQFHGRSHVFGISPDDVASHQAFRDKYALNFPLLSDPGHVVADRFGVWGPRPNGKEGIHRTTFVVRDGKVARVFAHVKPEGHAAEVLAAI
jgi:peroxiredoxin Q/BCP